MLENWHFDIFWPPHWVHAWNLWSAGWVIDTAKEWAFILIIFTFIPLWLTGWIGLSLVPWESLIIKLVMTPVKFVRSLFTPLKIVTKTPVVVKKKSYKEIRPTGPRTPIYDYNNESGNNKPSPGAFPPSPVPSASVGSSLPSASVGETRDNLKKKATEARDTFSHSLFNLDDDDDDFELDFDSFGKSDIFATDTNKNKEENKKEDSRNNRYSFDDKDDYYKDTRRNRDDKKRRQEDDDDDYKPRRKRYDDDDDDEDSRPRRKRYDDDDEDYKPRRKKYEEDEDDDYKPRRRDDRRDNKDNKKDFRREDNKSSKGRSDNKPSRDKEATEASSTAGRGNPVSDVLTQKGYKLLNSVTIKNTLIDFVGISDSKICLCLVDKEPGDWLADEERFNDEEPLWFSENSHRISPVRKVDIARQALLNKLEGSELDYEVKAYVIIQMGNIINAEDMFEIWNELDVDVTRINRGMPKEIKLFSKTIEEAEGSPDKGQLEAIKKLIRNI